MIGNYFFSSTGAAAYEIEQSLRFDGSSYLTRTPSSAGNRRTWTMSMWVKFSDDTINRRGMFGMPTGADNSRYVQWYIHNNDLKFSAYSETYRRSEAQYRDHSGWYHLVLRSDTTQSSEPDRLRIYVNGELIAARSTEQSVIDVPQNQQWGVNNTDIHYIGSSGGTAEYFFSGYIAEFYIVDGSSLAPTSFGEFDDNGVWRPIAYTGSYGTNGVYLKFDPSATNGIGHDHSGNGNNFTATGFTTSGTGTDVMDDTPTTNWCTLNPVQKAPDNNLLDGNLRFSGSVSKGMICGTQGASTGKYYFEFIVDDSGQDMSVGVTNLDQTNLNLHSSSGGSNIGRNTWSWGLYMYPLNSYIRKVHNSTYTDTSATKVSNGDVIGVAYDAGAGKIWASKNGTWMDSGDPAAGTNALFTNLSGTIAPAVMPPGGGVSTTNTANFGQRDFAYTPPTGFNSLNTANLPAPDIADGSDYFNTVLYTGTGGSSQSITGVGFAPDFVWIKDRTDARWHRVADKVRGQTRVLYPNDTAAEAVQAFSSLDSDGFTVLADTGNDGWNESGDAHVAWNWLAGGSGSSNTDGSITSTVSANPTAGFSIVTYTGTGANATVGHGLGVPPKMVIIKRRDVSSNWAVYHDGFGPTKVALLDDPIYAVSQGSTYWQSTAPSGTVVTLGTTSVVNYLNGTYVAYCFAEVEGYSKFGSYEGNNSTDGTFVYCGFKPAWIMVKGIDQTALWAIWDTQRNPYNVSETALRADEAYAESLSSGTNSRIDILSNGFKLRNIWQHANEPGTYIFAAFAEHPTGGSGVSPATAR